MRDFTATILRGLGRLPDPYRGKSFKAKLNDFRPVGNSLVSRLREALAVRGDEDEGNRIYFAATADRIKVGCTRDLTERVKALKRYHPGIEILGAVTGGYPAEAACHAVLSGLRASGREWFIRNEELNAAIAEILADG